MSEKERQHDEQDEQKQEQQQHQHQRTGFFIMPENALKSLKEELEIIFGESHVRKLLERYGYRCGEELAERVGISCEGLKEVWEVIETLWAEIGLGKYYKKELAGDELAVEFKEELAEHSCSFVAGYLRGVANRLTGEKFRCFEDSCRYRDGETCRFVLTPALVSLKPKAEKALKTAIKHKHTLEPGNVYLIKEETPNKTYELFLGLVTHGTNGIIITREYPEKVRTLYNLHHVPILWLTNLESENAIEPTELPRLYHELVNILKETKKIVIVLAGIEYLVSQNNFGTVLRFLQLARDQVIVNDAIMLLPINPHVFELRELKAIENELTVYSTPG